MAQQSTPLTIELELANVDRGVSESLVIKTARHPSETSERVWLRLLAFAWQWRPGMSLGSSICEPDEPDLAAIDATGKTTAMVFVGKPEPRRILRARSRAAAADAAILFESPERLRSFRRACDDEELTSRMEDLECAAVEQELLRALAAWDERRMAITITLSGDTFYLARGGQDISGELKR